MKSRYTWGGRSPDSWLIHDHQMSDLFGPLTASVRLSPPCCLEKFLNFPDLNFDSFLIYSPNCFLFVRTAGPPTPTKVPLVVKPPKQIKLYFWGHGCWLRQCGGRVQNENNIYCFTSWFQPLTSLFLLFKISPPSSRSGWRHQTALKQLLK